MELSDGFTNQIPDSHPEETDEWLESLDAVIETDGAVRARFLVNKLIAHAHQKHIGVPATMSTPYINTIPPELEPDYPGDEELEARIRRILRWNAVLMVTRANSRADGIGGHLSSYASSALLYEVGFNHFFRGKHGEGVGDHIYFQGHAAPGVYARAFLEGRLDADHLDNFRREIGRDGLSSYPHPRLMPKFWEYPTVSMGLGPINSIYQARFLRYLDHRGIDDTGGSRVWTFLGDGEVDEPETLGSISLAGREQLDNLTWVVNCNLQRLDGPVRGNGKIIQELEAMFRGAGWNVIKVIWGTNWDPLLAKDVDGALVRRMNESVDGDYQRYKANDGAYVRDHFFGPDPALKELVADMTDDEVWALRRGGLDYRKLYAAYDFATSANNRAPTVILAKTIKGFQLGKGVQGGMGSHQVKKLNNQQLKEFRDRLGLQDEIPDSFFEEGQEPPYYRPPSDSPEMRYLMERRNALGGSLPERRVEITKPLPRPDESVFTEFDGGSGKVEVSTTGVSTRLLRSLARDPQMGARVVPIIPDEGRTFGMDALFKELKIYAPKGQLYTPVDAGLLLSYTEAQDGQILEEGITEAGSMASWIAAATAYANRGVPMVPFFTFYSMFGFQRVGDLIWSAADSRARGFLLGATAGRTTLLGEGLQHQDGHSHILASTVPVVQAYDPAFAYELSAIVRDGLERMYGQHQDIFYYLTVYNENYVQPAKPEGSDRGILDGIYHWAPSPEGVEHRGSIIFSGSAHSAARRAQEELLDRWGIGVDLYSATSYKRLREDALETERWNRLHPGEEPHTPLVTRTLRDGNGPVVAVTDYMKMVPDMVARWIPRPFVPLGTDGFGRSDTREALRRFFEIDTGHVVVAMLSALARQGAIDVDDVHKAIAAYEIDTETKDPLYR